MGVIRLDNAFFMGYRGIKYTLLAVMIVIGITAQAQQSSHDKPTDKGGVSKTEHRNQETKVSTEFGLGVGARYNLLFDVTPLSSDFSPTIKMPVSYGAALQFRLNIGRTFGIQPEISYARSVLKINDSANKFNTKAKSNIVQVPMLLSFRIAMFRLNFGPVFTLMDETTYQLPRAEDNSIQQMHLGKLYPTVTYAAGISVKFARIMMLDLRYADQFVDTKSTNQYIWTLDQNKQTEAQSFRTRCRSVQLRFGVVF